eukprot:12924938-Alexandrium_andersonii.AAC.1
MELGNARQHPGHLMQCWRAALIPRTPSSAQSSLNTTGGGEPAEVRGALGVRRAAPQGPSIK